MMPSDAQVIPVCTAFVVSMHMQMQMMTVVLISIFKTYMYSKCIEESRYKDKVLLEQHWKEYPQTHC